MRETQGISRKTGKRGRPFERGHKKIPGSGFQPGQPRRATIAAREFCDELIHDQEYREALVRKARAGRLHPAVEVMVWHYAAGKPTERIEVSGSLLTADVSKMSDADLVLALQRALGELQAETIEAETVDQEQPALVAHVEEDGSVS